LRGGLGETPNSFISSVFVRIAPREEEKEDKDKDEDEEENPDESHKMLKSSRSAESIYFKINSTLLIYFLLAFWGLQIDTSS
jgi:hypothetical protein